MPVPLAVAEGVIRGLATLLGLNIPVVEVDLVGVAEEAVDCLVIHAVVSVWIVYRFSDVELEEKGPANKAREGLLLIRIVSHVGNESPHLCHSTEP